MCPGPRPEQPRRNAHGPGGLEAAAQRGSVQSGAAPSAAVALDGGRARRVVAVGGRGGRVPVVFSGASTVTLFWALVHVHPLVMEL